MLSECRSTRAHAPAYPSVCLSAFPPLLFSLLSFSLPCAQLTHPPPPPCYTAPATTTCAHSLVSQMMMSQVPSTTSRQQQVHLCCLRRVDSAQSVGLYPGVAQYDAQNALGARSHAAGGPSGDAVQHHDCCCLLLHRSYTCARCGSRYCTRKCYSVHTETRCLKFMA